MNRFWKSTRFRFALASMGLATVCAIGAWRTVRPVAAAQERPARAGGQQPVGPQYDEKGALRLPDGYRQWVFVGSSLGLSYSEGQQGGEMFHETLMEPTAYRHFVDTGSVREGTMLALILHGVGQNTLPARQGKFAAGVHAVEMAVKDVSHRAEGWAYYNFGGMNGLRATAQAMPKESCYNCHVQHAKRDNVFLQFYPLLAEAAHLTTAMNDASTPGAARSPAASGDKPTEPDATTTLALRGLDPVALTDGREEMGKPEIVASRGSYRYQFVSEPNRVRFAADPATFSIQNAMCLVVPDAPVDASLFAVYQKRIYAFATADCVKSFTDKPGSYVTSGSR